MNTSDFAQRLADKLIAQLREGTAPWQKPWTEGQAFGPYNPTTGNRYRGINVLALLGTDYTDPRWMTYKQAQAQGWQVRGGERSTQIQHWIWEEERVRVGQDGQPVLDSQKKFIKDRVRLERPKVITAAVFNAEQIDGIPALERERTYDWDPVEQAEKLLKASGAKIEHAQKGGAYYRLSSDTIHLPSQDRFARPNDYYATALHELGHWTGHPARLDRDLGNPFGSAGYAREELRAEIASLIMGSELGIGYDSAGHAGYVDHWVQILTDTPKEILYAAADAERISEYILTIEQKKELQHTQEVGVRKDIPYAERTYLAVPYAEREEAKALGARWDAVKKSWYVGPEAERAKIAKWDPKHQAAPTLDPRTEFAAVLRGIGGVVEGDHPIMNGEPQRIPAVKDKPGELTIFYVAHGDGVPNGYAENNRTKETVRWKATGQHLSPEVKADLAAEAERNRRARKQAEKELYEASAKRLAEELRINNSGVKETAYHQAKGIAATPGAPTRNGDVLVPGYDVDGKLWTVQYIKEDGTKRFAKNSRKHGCFHVVGAPNGAAALQKIAMSPVVVIAEGYATAATLAEHGKVPALAAYDSGNLLSVAASIRERWPGKAIIIAGDDDHRIENNPGREKALAAAEAVAGVAIFPKFSGEHRLWGFTDFNDLASEEPRLVTRQVEEVLQGLREKSQTATQGIEVAGAA
jgi:putative DNA primase/helicase